MFKRLIAIFIIFSFILSYYQPACAATGGVFAGDFAINQLPVPGTMVGVSAAFAPLALKGLVIDPNKPLEFKFIIDTGNSLPKNVIPAKGRIDRHSQLLAGIHNQEQLKQQSSKLIKYFLAGLTIPEGELWVNLSPYEKNRMVPHALGQTTLGRDLLAQDYVLKQFTASLIYPEKDLGKEFWQKIYKKAQEKFRTTNIPVNTFNKVWILPDQAQVFENGPAAYITKSTLKVMLDEDYLSLQKHNVGTPFMASHNRVAINRVSTDIIRQIILPEIEHEVNTGQNFAPLRQIYDALILAKWYKQKIQNSLMDTVYTNQNKIRGINLSDPSIKEQIYNRYLQAYKKGVFNYVKEDIFPPLDGEGKGGVVIPHKYFSGGLLPEPEKVSTDGTMTAVKADGAMVVLDVDLKKQKNTTSEDSDQSMFTSKDVFLEQAAEEIISDLQKGNITREGIPLGVKEKYFKHYNISSVTTTGGHILRFFEPSADILIVNGIRDQSGMWKEFLDTPDSTIHVFDYEDRNRRRHLIYVLLYEDDLTRTIAKPEVAQVTPKVVFQLIAQASDLARRHHQMQAGIIAIRKAWLQKNGGVSSIDATRMLRELIKHYQVFDSKDSSPEDPGLPFFDEAMEASKDAPQKDAAMQGSIWGPKEYLGPGGGLRYYLPDIIRACQKGKGQHFIDLIKKAEITDKNIYELKQIIISMQKLVWGAYKKAKLEKLTPEQMDVFSKRFVWDAILSIARLKFLGVPYRVQYVAPSSFKPSNYNAQDHQFKGEKFNVIALEVPEYMLTADLRPSRKELMSFIGNQLSKKFGPHSKYPPILAGFIYEHQKQSALKNLVLQAKEELRTRFNDLYKTNDDSFIYLADFYLRHRNEDEFKELIPKQVDTETIIARLLNTVDTDVTNYGYAFKVLLEDEPDRLFKRFPGIAEQIGKKIIEPIVGGKYSSDKVTVPALPVVLAVALYEGNNEGIRQLQHDARTAMGHMIVDEVVDVRRVKQTSRLAEWMDEIIDNWAKWNFPEKTDKGNLKPVSMDIWLDNLLDKWAAFQWTSGKNEPFMIDVMATVVYKTHRYRQENQKGVIIAWGGWSIPQIKEYIPSINTKNWNNFFLGPDGMKTNVVVLLSDEGQYDKYAILNRQERIVEKRYSYLHRTITFTVTVDRYNFRPEVLFHMLSQNGDNGIPADYWTDFAMNASQNGGIDLNQINVNHTGDTINVRFDPKQLEELLRDGFQGFAPLITGVQYIKSPFAILGVKEIN